MVTTAKEACREVCLMVMVNCSGSQMDRCRLGECSAWEWDTGSEEGVERLGHCALAGRTAALQTGKRRKR